MKKSHVPEGGRADPVERALLESFAEDAPPRGAKVAAMAALGVGIAGAETASAVGAEGSSAAAGVAKSTGTLASSALGSGATALTVVQWIGIGMLGGAAMLVPEGLATLRGAPEPALRGRAGGAPVAAVDVAQEGARGRTPAEMVSPPSGRAAKELIVEKIEAPTREPAPRGAEGEGRGLEAPRGARGGDHAATSVDARGAGVSGVALSPLAQIEIAPLASASPTVASPASSAVGARAQSRTSLAAEIAALDQTRRALAVGDARGASTLLDGYEREFAGGTLRPEAIVLRVEAWIALGDRARAAELARRSMGSLPERYAQRVRELLAR